MLRYPGSECPKLEIPKIGLQRYGIPGNGPRLGRIYLRSRGMPEIRPGRGEIKEEKGLGLQNRCRQGMGNLDSVSGPGEWHLVCVLGAGPGGPAANH